MTHLKKSFLFLFVGISLILSSCGKEEVSTTTEEDLRTQALEELVIELDGITDFETDETEKGVCSGSVGYHDVHSESNSNGVTNITTKAFVGDITGNFQNKWYYWHLDVKTPAHNYLNKSSKMIYADSEFIRGNVSVSYPANQVSSRSYLYLWTGSTWCRLDVSYKY